jgi:hypothetical protein
MLIQHMRKLRPLVFLALVLFLGLGKNVHAALPNETPVSDPVFADPFGGQSRIAVATDGRDFFAVWNDGRTRHSDGAVVGSRIDRDGNPLDPQNIFISRNSVGNLGVVWNGSSYTIVWHTNEGVHPSALRAVRVSRAGRVLGEERVLHENASFIPQSLASNGSRTLVGFQTRDGENHALLLDDELNVLSDLTLPATSPQNFYPILATNGSHFVAMWTTRLGTNDSSIVAVRISFSGTLLDTTPVRVGDGSALGLASDGADFVALSHDAGLFSIFLLPANLQNASSARALPDAERFESIRLLYAGDRYVAIGPRFKSGVLTLVATNIDRAGIPGDADLLHTPPSYNYAAAALDGNLLALWTRPLNPNDGTHTRLYARRFSGDPLEADAAEKAITSSAVWQESPDIASNGSGYVVAWREETGIYAARLQRDGVSVDGRGLQLSKERLTTHPEVLWDGRQYIISYGEYKTGAPESVLRFITPAQGLLEDRVVGAGTPIATGPDGVTLLISGKRLRRFFGATRTYENATVQVAPESERATGFLASWNGSEYLVTWTEEMLDPNSWQFEFYVGRRIRGVRLNRELTLIDTAPKTIGDIQNAIDTLTGIATDGKDWLVTWETNFEHVRAQRVLANGTLGTNTQGIFIANGFGSDVTFDGTRYVMAWKGGLPFADYPNEHQPLMAGHVTREGALSAVIAYPRTEMPTSVSITRAPFGAVIAYSRLDVGTGGSPRVFVRGVESIQGRRRAVR